MDDTRDSITLDDIEESELEQAAQFPYVDNITCSCRGMCSRERGRNACPCWTISQSCLSACRPDCSACMNTNSVLGGNSSESEEQSEESLLVCLNVPTLVCCYNHGICTLNIIMFCLMYCLMFTCVWETTANISVFFSTKDSSFIVIMVIWRECRI